MYIIHKLSSHAAASHACPSDLGVTGHEIRLQPASTMSSIIFPTQAHWNDFNVYNTNIIMNSCVIKYGPNIFSLIIYTI